MRFGIFVPQGWRFDLVGIDPADQWATTRSLAQAADAGSWESLWVYGHFHTTPKPSEEATHEAWTLMSAFDPPWPARRTTNGAPFHTLLLRTEDH